MGLDSQILLEVLQNGTFHNIPILLRILRRGYVHIARSLLEIAQNYDLDSLAGKILKDDSAFEQVCKTQDSEFTKFFLEKTKKTSVLNKALLEAYGKRRWSRIYWLIENGADINLQDKYRQTPLHMAAAKGKVEIVRLLLEKRAEVNSRNNGGQTPLHMAAGNEKVEIVLLLLEKGAEVNSPDQSRQTPLHMAVSYGKSKAIKVLLEKGAEVNSSDQSGQTPLHMVAFYGNSEAVMELLNQGADINSRDHYTRLPFYCAVSHGRYEIARLLSKEGRGELSNTSQNVKELAKINIDLWLYLDEIKNRKEDYMPRIPLFKGYSKQQKIAAAEALNKVIRYRAKEDSPQQHQGALNNGKLGLIYARYKKFL